MSEQTIFIGIFGGDQARIGLDRENSHPMGRSQPSK